MEGEELQGWLIPNNVAEAFEKEWIADSVNDDVWGDFFGFAVWGIHNNIVTINFE